MNVDLLKCRLQDFHSPVVQSQTKMLTITGNNLNISMCHVKITQRKPYIVPSKVMSILSKVQQSTIYKSKE